MGRICRQHGSCTPYYGTQPLVLPPCGQGFASGYGMGSMPSEHPPPLVHAVALDPDAEAAYQLVGEKPSDGYAAIYSFRVSAETPASFTVQAFDGTDLSPDDLQIPKSTRIWTDRYHAWRKVNDDGSVSITVAFRRSTKGSFSIGDRRYAFDSDHVTGIAPGDAPKQPHADPKSVPGSSSGGSVSQKIPDAPPPKDSTPVVGKHPSSAGKGNIDKSPNPGAPKEKAVVKETAQPVQADPTLKSKNEALEAEVAKLKLELTVQTRELALSEAADGTKQLTVLTDTGRRYVYRSEEAQMIHDNTQLYVPSVCFGLTADTGKFQWTLWTGEEAEVKENYAVLIDRYTLHDGSLLELEPSAFESTVVLDGKFKNSKGEIRYGTMTLAGLRTFLTDSDYETHIGSQITKLRETYELFKKWAPPEPQPGTLVAVRDPSKPVDCPLAQSPDLLLAKEVRWLAGKKILLAHAAKYQLSSKEWENRAPADRWYLDRKEFGEEGKKVTSHLIVTTDNKTGELRWRIRVPTKSNAMNEWVMVSTNGESDWRKHEIVHMMGDICLRTTAEKLKASQPDFYAMTFGPNEEALDELGKNEIPALKQLRAMDSQKLGKMKDALARDVRLLEAIADDMNQEGPNCLGKAKKPENGFFFAIEQSKECYGYWYIRENPDKPGELQFRPDCGKGFTDFSIPGEKRWLSMNDWRNQTIELKVGDRVRSLTVTNMQLSTDPKIIALYKKYIEPFERQFDRYSELSLPNPPPFYTELAWPEVRRGRWERSKHEHSFYVTTPYPGGKGHFSIYFRANPDDPSRLDWQLYSDSSSTGISVPKSGTSWNPAGDWRNRKVKVNVDEKEFEVTLNELERLFPEAYKQYIAPHAYFLDRLESVQQSTK